MKDMYEHVSTLKGNHVTKAIYSIILPRVHNISREGECLTAYTCFKRTALSTESTPSGVN